MLDGFQSKDDESEATSLDDRSRQIIIAHRAAVIDQANVKSVSGTAGLYTRPSVAPAVSVIVAGSPVERRHRPALLRLTVAANTCEAPSVLSPTPELWNWVLLRAKRRLQLFPIFPHPPSSASRISSTTYRASRERDLNPRDNSAPLRSSSLSAPDLSLSRYLETFLRRLSRLSFAIFFSSIRLSTFTENRARIFLQRSKRVLSHAVSSLETR